MIVPIRCLQNGAFIELFYAAFLLLKMPLFDCLFLIDFRLVLRFPAYARYLLHIL